MKYNQLQTLDERRDSVARVTKPIEERRKEIIDTARELFVENGFDKPQIVDISKKMSVAQGLVYHYFKSKTDILYAVIEVIAEERTNRMGKVLDEMEGTARERLTFLLKAPPMPNEYGKLIPSLLNDSAIIEYCLKQLIISALPQLLSMIEWGNTDGSWDCKNPQATASFILHGISGIMGTSPSIYCDEDGAAVLIDIIFRILKPPK